MTGGHPIIRLSGITKTYGQGQAAFQALKGIDLEVAQGEFIAVMGPSGSGKSTAMNIIGCLDTPSTGTYEFQGIRVETLTRDQRALLRRHLLGFVFQGFNLLARTSAIENVELPLIYRSAPSAARKAAARAALAQVGLAGWEHHTPAELSGGQQQRVAIARAIAKRPEVLLCDEPTGALDSATGVRVLEALASVNEELGTTTAIITHNAAIRAMADRVIHMADGRISETVVNERRLEPASITW